MVAANVVNNHIDIFYNDLFLIEQNNCAKSNKNFNKPQLPNLELFYAIRSKLSERSSHVRKLGDLQLTLGEFYLCSRFMTKIEPILKISAVETIKKELRLQCELILDSFDNENEYQILDALIENNSDPITQTPIDSNFKRKLFAKLETSPLEINAQRLKLLWIASRDNLFNFITVNKQQLKTNMIIEFLDLSCECSKLTQVEKKQLVDLFESIIGSKLENKLIIQFIGTLTKACVTLTSEQTSQNLGRLVEKALSIWTNNRLSSLELELAITQLTIKSIHLRNQVKPVLNKIMSEFNLKSSHIVRLKTIDLLIDQFYSDANDSNEDPLFDRIYSTLVLKNKTFEDDTHDPSISIRRISGLDFAAIKKFYGQTKRVQSDPIYAKYMVLYMFKRLLNLKFLQLKPNLLVKFLFGLMQISVEYGRYFEKDVVRKMFKAELKITFENELIQKWMDIYVSEWSDDLDLDQMIEDKFPLELFGLGDKEAFLENYSHLILEHCWIEFGKISKIFLRNEKVSIL